MGFATGIYAQRPARRLAQVIADLLVVAWTCGWWFAGRAVQRSVAAVADPARQTGDTARRLAEQVGQAGEQAARVPALGGELRRPFDEASGTLRELVTQADQQVASIERAGLLLGWLVFVIPVALVLVMWLPARIRFFLRARAASRFLDAQADLDLFALRAMVAQPMHVIAKISDDPVAAWRRGDRSVINALAAVELRRAGLRPPPGVAGP